MTKPAAASRLRDFGSYATLEASNAVLVPAIALYFGWPADRIDAILLAVADLALIIGLVVGAAYWWGVAARLKRNRGVMVRALRLADIAQRPMLVATIAAMIGCAWQVIDRGMTLPNIVALVLTTLAGLEYINYYHIQLQHFDNLADIRRLLGGKAFRRAHMARDLASYRARKTRSHR